MREGPNTVQENFKWYARDTVFTPFALESQLQTRGQPTCQKVFYSTK